jgi:DNA repair protein RecN (Recombination protein N)
MPRLELLIEPGVKAFDTALTALDEARSQLEAALASTDHDPRELERIEERLFALRAAARKYNVPVDGLNALAARHADDLALIDAGAEQLAALEKAAAEAAERYRKAAVALSGKRRKAAEKLDRAVNAELKPCDSSARHSPPMSRAMKHHPVRTGSIASSSGCRPIPARGRAR